MSDELRLGSIARKLFESVRLFGLAAGQIGPPKEEKVISFAYGRVAPLGAMLFAAEHFAVELDISERLTFFYSTVNWPADVPPAGWVVELPSQSRDIAFRAMVGFWCLQSRGDASDRLMRGALWVLHHHGYNRALDFVLDSITSGVIVNAATARDMLTALLKARRKVAGDDHLFRYFSPSVPATLVAWTKLDVRGPPLDFLHRPRRFDLHDDFDLLSARCASLIDTVRAASNADEWIMGLAELSRLARVIAELFQNFELDKDLAYGAFTAQVEEIKADGATFFISYGEEFDDRDRAAISWVPAVAMGKMAAAYDAAWLEQIMEERVLVPDALLDLYFEAPDQFAEQVASPWIEPSAHVRAAFAEMAIDEPSFYRFTPVGTGFLPISDDMLRDALAESGLTVDDEDLAMMLDVLRRGYGGEVKTSGSQNVPYVGNVAVTEATAVRLAALAGVDAWRLDGWLARAYRRACRHFALASLEALMKSEPSYFASLADFVTAFPNFSSGYQELAIELDQSGQPEKAWPALETALTLEPDNDLIWQSAAVLLDSLGDHDQAMVARFMARFLQDRSPPA